MKKLRFLSLLLALSLLLSLPVQAAEHSAENFVRTKTYQDHFSDLSPLSIFYDNITALYEYGLSIGRGDGTFGVEDPLTVGDTIIFAARIRCLYETGSPEPRVLPLVSPESTVRHPYLLYLKDRGLLGDELDSLLGKNATRAEMAHVLARLLPPEVLPPINEALINESYATHRFIPDVTEYTPYFQDILQLYRTGISQGNDSRGSYYPDELITRGEAAAMLTRMVDPTLRVTPSWYSVQGITLADLVPDVAALSAPVTTQEIYAAVQHMLASGSNTLDLRYPSLTEQEASRIMEEALRCVKAYCEQSYNTVSCTYTLQGEMTLVFSASGLSAEKLQAYRADTLAAAIALHDKLWAEGSLHAAMSDREKALVYYTWIAEHCVYDDNAGSHSLSHLPYNVFFQGKAVCDGYTGAYNLLLKLEGIPCYALSGDNHIWTVAVLDGEEVHIDVTWGDQPTYVDESFFAMTAQESSRHHPW